MLSAIGSKCCVKAGIMVRVWGLFPYLGPVAVIVNAQNQNGVTWRIARVWREVEGDALRSPGVYNAGGTSTNS